MRLFAGTKFFAFVCLNRRPTCSSGLSATAAFVSGHRYLESASRERESEVVRLATAEAQRAFDLETGTVTADDPASSGAVDWVFLLSMHNIVCRWLVFHSVFKELSELYLAFNRRQAVSFGWLPIQYSDFACWQREYLNAGVLERQLVYWRKQLEDLPQLSCQPNRPRPAVFSSSERLTSFRCRAH